MKTLKVKRLLKSARWLCTALAIFPAILATAQDSRPDYSKETKFPQNLPASARLDVSAATLEQLFRSEGNVSVALSPSFLLKGTIENKDVDKSGDGTMLIRTEGIDGTMLSIARFTDGDLSVHYTGHFLKLHAAEGMLLVEKDRSYYFIRTQQRYLLAE